MLNAVTGEPINKASILLKDRRRHLNIRYDPADFSAVTDASGKFKLEIEPGSYFILADKNGFIRDYTPNGPGSTITRISPGQSLKLPDFKVNPASTISGRVLDEDGEPLANVFIQASQKRYHMGIPNLYAESTATSNEVGDFRISDLAAGQYLIRAGYRSQMASPKMEYSATYYPGTRDESLAQAINVGTGQDIPALRFKMKKEPVFSIQGKVSGAVDVAPQMVSVLSQGLGQNLSQSFPQSAAIRSDGTFEITGVAAGSYFLLATIRRYSTYLGKVPVELTNASVEGITLPVSVPTTLRGTVRLDGDSKDEPGKQPNWPSVRVKLVPASGSQLVPQNVMSNKTGEWQLNNLIPDKYRFVLSSGLSATNYVKAIRSESADLLRDGIDLTNGFSGPVEIVYGSGAGFLQGKVEDGKQQPVASSIVTLVPDPFQQGRFDLFQDVKANKNGEFTFNGIAPGEYTVYAWTSLPSDAYMNADYLRPFAGSGKRISIKSKSREYVNLLVIP